MTMLEGGRDGPTIGKRDENLGLLDEVKTLCASIERNHNRLITEFLEKLPNEEHHRSSSESDPDPVSAIEGLELEDFDFDPQGNKPTYKIGRSQDLEASVREIEEEEEEEAEEIGPFRGFVVSGIKEEECWSLLREMVEIVEKNVKKQADLERRNEHNKIFIRVLRMSVKGLMAENKALDDLLVGPKVDYEVAYMRNKQPMKEV